MDKEKEWFNSFITSIPQMKDSVVNVFQEIQKMMKSTNAKNLKYDGINQFTDALLVIISVGVIVRIGYCLIKIMSDEDSKLYKKRILHAIVFYILAISLYGIKDTILTYFL